MAAPSLPTVAGEPPAVGFAGPPAMPPARYELGAEIARGGMGRVVDATDTVLGRTVALKEVLSLDQDVLRRFARETRITARLEHPSIVPVHDAGTMGGGVPFYVMRKISGRPLERLVAAADTLNQRLVLIPHIVAACAAIAHAHERGVVHRDIKPSNILVGELGETIVIDWGLAKLIGEVDDVSDATRPLRGGAPLKSGALLPSARLADDADTDIIKTRAGIVYGTPGFMSPEQLRGAPVTERCDVYALGATLYHLLSRKPPHHAKTADEMMRAAVREPPTPVSELVPGVPAELATIIDKALAHDETARYQDARALAEDLQRFLSGQLVASHHYSRRERLVRFVRKHRVPVGIAAAATLALVVIGALAVTRVVRERDRADDAAAVAIDRRARAELAAEELTLAQARFEVERNPTRALAMLKPLASRRWRDVRSIAAAARARGVAFGMPAAKRTATLELSRDGTHALAAGADGEVRHYDLAARTSRVIPHRLGPGVRARFADEDRVALWHGRKLTITDPAGRALRTIEAPAPIRDVQFAGAIAYWGDTAGALWTLAAGATAPVQIALPEPLGEPRTAAEFLLAPSPDGRYLALRGRDHLLLLDRTLPAGEPPSSVTLGAARELDWSSDGMGFGALLGNDAILVVVDDDGAHIRRRRFVGERDGVVFGNDRLYTIGPLGVAMVAREEEQSGQRYQNFVGDPVGMREARGNAIVAASHGTLAVLSELGDRALLAPAGFFQHVQASPRSPYVVAAIEGQLVVWNLDDIEPRRLAGETPALMKFAGPHHAIVSFEESGVQWVDLASGKLSPLGRWQLRSVAASPSGALACALDIGHRARLIAPGKEPVLLDGEYDVAGFASETALLLGNGGAGTVHLYDAATGKRTTLVANGSKLVDLAWNRAAPPWIAAAFSDGTLWRRNLATGATTTAPARAVLSTHLQVARDGTVLYADERAVRAWRPTERLDKLVEFEAPVQAIGLAGPDHLFVALHGDGGAPDRVPERATYLVSLAAPQSPASLDILTPSKVSARDDLSASMAADAGAMVLANSGSIEVIDAIAKHRWTLANAPPPATLAVKSTVSYTEPQISNDGTRVLARLATALVTWSIEVPGDGAATQAWIERLTNATMEDPSSGKLSWR